MTQLLTTTLGRSVFTVHRLDRAVGGVMVYALTPEAAADLFEQIRTDQCEKEYYAVLPKAPAESEGELKDLLFFDNFRRKSFVVQRNRQGVRDAVLHYRVVSQKNGLCLVHIRLQTGRTHQIRVQFASRKMPLLGDRKYGSREKGCPIALWSTRISFLHPETHERVEFSAPAPDDFPWDTFEW